MWAFAHKLGLGLALSQCVHYQISNLSCHLPCPSVKALSLCTYTTYTTYSIHAQSCKKRETLYDPEIFIQNFTRDILHHQFCLKSQVAPLKQKIIAQLKKKVMRAFTSQSFPQNHKLPL